MEFDVNHGAQSSPNGAVRVTPPGEAELLSPESSSSHNEPNGVTAPPGVPDLPQPVPALSRGDTPAVMVSEPERQEAPAAPVVYSIVADGLSKRFGKKTAVESVSVAQLRRYLVAHQGFATRPRASPATAVAATVKRLGCVQLDSISTVDRAHRLTLGSRLGRRKQQAWSMPISRPLSTCKALLTWPAKSSA